jgi:anti-sigma factor RsiW
MEPNAIELVCREVVELVTEYLGGTLPATDRERFDRHLATCPPCTAYLAQIKTTLELATELGTAGAPADDQVAEQLGDMFRRWHGKREP